MKSAVSERGQVTIPKALRDRLGLRPGSVLEFSADRGLLVARKITERNPADRVYGILTLDASTDDLVTELRGPTDAT